MSNPRNVRELFALWPSREDVAKQLGVSYFTIASWIRRDAVPRDRWKALLRAARNRNIPLDAQTLALIAGPSPGVTGAPRKPAAPEAPHAA